MRCIEAGIQRRRHGHRGSSVYRIDDPREEVRVAVDVGVVECQLNRLDQM